MANAQLLMYIYALYPHTESIYTWVEAFGAELLYFFVFLKKCEYPMGLSDLENPARSIDIGQQNPPSRTPKTVGFARKNRQKYHFLILLKKTDFLDTMHILGVTS